MVDLKTRQRWEEEKHDKNSCYLPLFFLLYIDNPFILEKNQNPLFIMALIPL